MTDQTPQDILREAAEYIGEHGWNQGDYVDRETGAVCALGAIHKVTDWPLGNKVLAERLLSDEVGVGYGFIPRWNDAPERTAEDVILAMKRAAEL